MLGKQPPPTFNQYVNSLRGFDMREDGEEVIQQGYINMSLLVKEEEVMGVTLTIENTHALP